MKTASKIFFLSLFMAFMFTGYCVRSQENYSFMKLLVENDKDQILLVKWGGEWELPGSKFNEPTSVKKFLQGMAGTLGVEIENHQLFGLYTQRWKGLSYLTLMHYYKASYVSGELKVPDDCTDIGWFSMEEALTKIPYDNMKSMIKWLEEKPGKVASAAFERFKDENNATQFVTLEDWHSLN